VRADDAAAAADADGVGDDAAADDNAMQEILWRVDRKAGDSL
jgi:hypothetical protein